MNRAISALVCASIVTLSLAPVSARAQRDELPRLALLPPKTENPLDLLRRARRNQRTGIALLAIGGVHLHSTIATTVMMFNRSTADGLAGAVVLSSTIGTGIVGAHLLGAGIPTYVGGRRQEQRAMTAIGALPESERTEEQIERRWSEPPPVAMRRAEASRVKGISLMAIGAVNFALMAAAGGAVAWCVSVPRQQCPDLLLVGAIPTIPFTAVAGMFTMGFGGRWYVDARDELDHLDTLAADAPRTPRPPREPRVELSVMLGSTVGLTGTF